MKSLPLRPSRSPPWRRVGAVAGAGSVARLRASSSTLVMAQVTVEAEPRRRFRPRPNPSAGQEADAQARCRRTTLPTISTAARLSASRRSCSRAPSRAEHAATCGFCCDGGGRASRWQASAGRRHDADRPGRAGRADADCRRVAGRTAAGPAVVDLRAGFRAAARQARRATPTPTPVQPPSAAAPQPRP